MIRTSRSRLEIRQEPDATASVAGLALVSFGLVEMITMSLGGVVAWAFDRPFAPVIACVRFVLGALFVASGWLFLRGRSRVVIDLEHRMVARYLGVGGQSVGGNRTWDLGEFDAVVLVSRERRRLLFRESSRSWVVCLRRRDGDELELYWTGDAQDGARAAAAAADFAELPYFGREPG